MGFPSFNSGDVLTATDMNAVGLWLVKTQTVGTGVSSVEVTGAFSSTYDNYRIIYSGGTSNTVQAIKMTLGASAASYYGNLWGASYTSTTVSGNDCNNQASWIYAGITSTINNSIIMDIMNPYLSKVTTITSQYLATATNGYTGTFNGFHNVASSYTAFTLSVTGTITGGTIRVYGYRN